MAIKWTKIMPKLCPHGLWICPQEALKSHFQAVHHTNGLLHECTFCPKVFPNRGALKRHLLTHSSTANSDLICPLCQVSFANQSALTNHMKSHGNELYVCPKCGQKDKHHNCHFWSMNCSINSCCSSWSFNKDSYWTRKRSNSIFFS